MAYAFSKVFGPTDSVAGTKTAVGSTYVIRPGSYTIQSIHVAKGNVVDAKECAGLITVEITGVDGTYQYAYGNGNGGATNSISGPHETIECRIPAPGGATITVSVTDAEIAKDVTVGLDFYSGGLSRVDSYSTGGAGKDPAADTELEIGTITVTKAGRIKQIRYAAGNLVDAKASSGKLVVEVPGVAGPFEYPVGNGAGGAAQSGGTFADVFNVDIPVTENLTITFNVTHAEAMDSATVSIAVV